jgi:effector-binding domain-containing protein
MTASAPAIERATVSESPPRRVLSRHAVVKQKDLAATLGRTFGELYAQIGAAGIEPDGPPFVTYHEGTQAGLHWDIDICAPISAPIEAPAGFVYTELPASKVVTLLHVGPYHTLGVAHDALERFVADHRLAFAGPPREFYLSEPDVAPSEIQTLIERPVSRT